MPTFGAVVVVSRWRRAAATRSWPRRLASMTLGPLLAAVLVFGATLLTVFVCFLAFLSVPVTGPVCLAIGLRRPRRRRVLPDGVVALSTWRTARAQATAAATKPPRADDSPANVAPLPPLRR